MKFHLLVWALLGMMPCFLYAQKEPAQLPVVQLSGETGSPAGGGTWSSNDLKGKASLVVILDPDEIKLHQILARSIEQTPLEDRAVHLILCYDVQASWRPSRLLRLGNWLERAGQTFQEARTEGVIQALFVSTGARKTNWTVLFDETRTLLSTWSLPVLPYQVLLIDPAGNLVHHHRNEVRTAEAARLCSRLARLAATGG